MVFGLKCLFPYFVFSFVYFYFVFRLPTPQGKLSTEPGGGGGDGGGGKGGLSDFPTNNVQCTANITKEGQCSLDLKIFCQVED